MSADLPPLLVSDIIAMGTTIQAHHAALKAYADACQDFDWVAAEAARLVAVGSLEAFLDAHAAGWKFVESRGNDGDLEPA